MILTCGKWWLLRQIALVLSEQNTPGKEGKLNKPTGLQGVFDLQTTIRVVQRRKTFIISMPQKSCCHFQQRCLDSINTNHLSKQGAEMSYSLFNLFIWMHYAYTDYVNSFLFSLEL